MGQECYCSATICQKGCQIQNSGPLRATFSFRARISRLKDAYFRWGWNALILGGPWFWIVHQMQVLFFTLCLWNVDLGNVSGMLLFCNDLTNFWLSSNESLNKLPSACGMLMFTGFIFGGDFSGSWSKIVIKYSSNQIFGNRL